MVKEIEGSGGKAVAVKADVSKMDEVTALFKDAAEAFPDEKIEVRSRVTACRADRLPIVTSGRATSRMES